MSMLSLERRRSNPKAIYWACMVGLSIAIPVLIALPRFLTATNVNGDNREAVHVISINNSEVEFKHPDGGVATLPLSEFRESYGLGGAQ